MTLRLCPLSIDGLRRRAAAVATAALLVVPVALALLGGPGGQPRAGPAARPAPRRQLYHEVVAARERVARLARETSSTLEVRLAGDDPTDRLLAANLLWARGEQDRVEAAARTSRDVALHAKLAAMKERHGRH